MGLRTSKRDLADRVREWLVQEDREPTPDAVGAALESLGVVAEPGVLAQIIQQLGEELLGAGALQSLIDESAVTDVLVNGTGSVWIDRGSGLQRQEITVGDEPAVRRLAQRLAAQAGRRLDDAQPFVDARLPDGTRLHAALAPVASPGTLICLRSPARRDFDLDKLQDAGTITPNGVWWLKALMAARLSFLVIGGTGSGKTTILRCLLEQVPQSERILVVEESAELRPAHNHCVALEGRPRNAEGAGGINLSDLMRQAMRMRPDRIVVGEVRGPEVVQLLAAMNTGHEGCAGTIHANSPAALPARLEALAVAAGLNRAAVHSQLAAGLEAVLHVERANTGERRLSSLGVVVPGERASKIVPLITFSADRPILHLPRHPIATRMFAVSQEIR